MFMEVQREVDLWLQEISETISRLSPVSEDSETAKTQLANTKVGKKTSIAGITSRMRRE